MSQTSRLFPNLKIDRLKLIEKNRLKSIKGVIEEQNLKHPVFNTTRRKTTEKRGRTTPDSTCCDDNAQGKLGPAISNNGYCACARMLTVVMRRVIGPRRVRASDISSLDCGGYRGPRRGNVDRAGRSAAGPSRCLPIS